MEQKRGTSWDERAIPWLLLPLGIAWLCFNIGRAVVRYRKHPPSISLPAGFSY